MIIRFFIFFSLLWSLGARAFNITNLNVDCGQSVSCEDYKFKFKSLISKYSDYQHLEESLKVYLKDGGVKQFNYELIADESGSTLFISFQIKPIIKEIDIQLHSKTEISFSKKTLAIKEGDYFDQSKIDDSIQMIRSNLDERGFLDVAIDPVIERDGDDIYLSFNIGVAKIKKIRRFNIQTSNNNLVVFIRQRLLPLINRAPDTMKIKSILRSIEQDLFNSGHYYAVLSLEYIKQLDGIWVEPTIKLDNDKMYLMTLQGNKTFDRADLLTPIRESLRKNLKVLDVAFITKEIKAIYANHAYNKTEVGVIAKDYFGKNNQSIKHFFITINEGKKAKVKSISFIGNQVLSSKQLTKLFYKEATDLASRNYLDEAFLNSFSDKIKTEYLKLGYVQVEVSLPTMNLQNSKYEIEYKINEYEQTLVERISFTGVDESIANELKNVSQNKQGQPFNPLIFSDDIKNIQNYLRNLGYYYANIKNIENNQLIKYSEDNLNLSIDYDIELGEKVFLDKVIVIGNIQTRPTVITREIFIQKGEIITPDTVDAIKNTLTNLGLFSTVKVIPLKETIRNGHVDLLVSVKEKNFGTVDLAPGFRTDLGPKISSGITYNNIGGMNRTLSLRAQVNKRDNGSTLDQRRRDEGKANIEHNVRASFTEPYIFGYPYAYTGALSTFKRRFYSFDANIIRFNNTLNKEFNSYFSTSLTHQFETIDQSDATNTQDNGYFQIGALIPSVTFDFRDNRTNPLKGAFFNLSIENAAPRFLSQKNDNLTVDYYKLVSRNSFYFPLAKIGVLAISVAVGQQKNLGNGYIPSIKVFRISGVDIVRGYDNGEINRLKSGPDISSIRVSDVAYFSNIKVEPRYFINDETMLGVFFDAGRVYVDSFEPLDLRTSAGISFKYLTPVGSLNFDYGYKLNRRHYPDGSYESPGRFHVSIGFF